MDDVACMMNDGTDGDRVTDGNDEDVEVSDAATRRLTATTGDDNDERLRTGHSWDADAGLPDGAPMDSASTEQQRQQQKQQWLAGREGRLNSGHSISGTGQDQVAVPTETISGAT